MGEKITENTKNKEHESGNINYNAENVKKPVIINIQKDFKDIWQTTTSTKLVLDKNPINLKIDTSTDWPIIIVGVAGILSSIIIARYTSKTQSNQIKSNIANMRQKWIEDLRSYSSEFLEKMSYLINKIEDTEGNYLESHESSEPYSKFIGAQIKISLMLDMDHAENREIITTSEEIIKFVKKCHDDSMSFNEKNKKIAALGEKFEKLIRECLDKAWRDIKKDLTGIKGNK